MFIFESYTEEDHDLLTEMALYNAEFERYKAMYEMAGLTLNAMKAEAAAKVIVESGNEDDYNYLVQEAEAEVAGEKKGVFAKMVEALKNFFARIVGFFKQKKTNFDAPDENGKTPSDEETVEVSKDLIEKVNVLEKAADSLSSGWQRLQGGDMELIKNILGGVAIGGAAIGAGATVVVKRKELKALFEKLEAKAATIKSHIDSKSGAVEGEASEKTDIRSQLAAKSKECGEALRKVGGMISSLLSGNKKKDAEPAPEDVSKEKSRTVKGKNGQKYTLPEKGTQNSGKYRIRHKGKKGANSGEFSDNVPDDIADAIDDAENNGKTVGETVEFLRENFGDKYIIEASDDGFIDIIDRPSTMDLAINSIFGYDISNEQILSESASGFDKEIAELSQLFEKL